MKRDRKKPMPAPTLAPMTRAMPCHGVVYKGFNVKTRCSKIGGHAGYCG